MEQQEQREWLTVRQVARLLHYSEKTVRKYIEEGLIPGTRPLGPLSHYRVNRRDLEDYIRQEKAQLEQFLAEATQGGTWEELMTRVSTQQDVLYRIWWGYASLLHAHESDGKTAHAPASEQWLLDLLRLIYPIMQKRTNHSITVEEFREALERVRPKGDDQTSIADLPDD